MCLLGGGGGREGAVNFFFKLIKRRGMGIQASVCSYCNQDKEINKKKRCILHTGVVLQIWS